MSYGICRTEEGTCISISEKWLKINLWLIEDV